MMNQATNVKPSPIDQGAVVNKPGAPTHGRACVVVSYESASDKYQVEFDGGWVGWYHLDELTLDS